MSGSLRYLARGTAVVATLYPVIQVGPVSTASAVFLRRRRGSPGLPHIWRLLSELFRTRSSIPGRNSMLRHLLCRYGRIAGDLCNGPLGEIRSQCRKRRWRTSGREEQRVDCEEDSPSHRPEWTTEDLRTVATVENGREKRILLLLRENVHRFVTVSRPRCSLPTLMDTGTPDMPSSSRLDTLDGFPLVPVSKDGVSSPTPTSRTLG